MIMYVSKGGFRVEAMLFSLDKKPYKIKLVVQLFIVCIPCVLICARPLPREPNTLNIYKKHHKSNIKINFNLQCDILALSLPSATDRRCC